MAEDRQVELRVGVFVMSALLIGAGLAFLIGNQKNLFRSKTYYVAEFESVEGLRPGGPIRIAGVDVGTVRSVEFEESGRIRVELGIVDEATQLVRDDTLASIGSKGLLGDQLVDLTVGTGKPLAPGGKIMTETPVGLATYMARAGGLIAGAERTMENLERATDAIGQKQFGEDIRQITHNLAVLSDTIAKKDGAIVRILEDPGSADRIAAALDGAATMTAEFGRTARSARLLLDEVRTGSGGAHELIYGRDSARLVSRTADAFSELTTTLESIRSSDSFAHHVLYGDDGGAMFAHLTSASEDVAAVTRSMREGRGTLGALLMDPSIYEDVKRLVGNLQRNDVLRALVRYSITADERQPTHQVAPAR